MWDNRSAFVSNHDGDTVTYLSDMGRRIHNEAEVRLLGVWAPELSQPGGPETKAFVEKWHQDRAGGHRWPFLVVTMLVRAQDPDTSEAKKTLDRLVAVVTCVATNESLNLAVTDFVAARGYGGGIGSPS